MEVFYEDGESECDICFEDRDRYFRKLCDCSGIICMGCFLTMKSDGNYVCPFCRSPAPAERNLSSHQIRSATLKWNIWFQELF